MNVGSLGVWALVDSLTANAEAQLARDVEQWGYSALWTGEAMGRDVLVNSAWLLANTRTLVVASGIANIYARDAMAMAAARAQLNEQSGGRFLLGIGISHAPLVNSLRGHAYDKPVTTMRTYIEAMARAHYSSPRHPEPPLTVLAALGPKMLALARDLTDGAHPYNTTVAQTAEARDILGPGKLLCVEQKLAARIRSRACPRDRARESAAVSRAAELREQLAPCRFRRPRLRRQSVGPTGRCAGCAGATKRRSSRVSANIGQPARIMSASTRSIRIPRS